MLNRSRRRSLDSSAYRAITVVGMGEVSSLASVQDVPSTGARNEGGGTCRHAVLTKIHAARTTTGERRPNSALARRGWNCDRFQQEVICKLCTCHLLAYSLCAGGPQVVLDLVLPCRPTCEYRLTRFVVFYTHNIFKETGRDLPPPPKLTNLTPHQLTIPTSQQLRR